VLSAAAPAKSSLPIYDEDMNLGMPEMIFILLLALVVVGPRRLPELARQLGKFLAEFKRASNEFKQQLETEMLNIELEERAKKAQEEPKVLPDEEPFERIVRPILETVGRTRLQLAAGQAQKTSDPAAQPTGEPEVSTAAPVEAVATPIAPPAPALSSAAKP
jgi:sec-independent protein translocase protein TatB